MQQLTANHDGDANGLEKVVRRGCERPTPADHPGGAAEAKLVA